MAHKSLRLRSHAARLTHRLGHWGPLIGGFVALALAFAADIDQLDALRQSLRDEIEHSPLMRDDIACAHFAHALRTMWLQWEAKQKYPDCLVSYNQYFISKTKKLSDKVCGF